MNSIRTSCRVHCFLPITKLTDLCGGGINMWSPCFLMIS
uniref:Uncharacterized protein n=1 Tax=Anguilla anguilla TaxID=7936 RepID=A0A0E9SRB2_ANGAN